MVPKTRVLCRHPDRREPRFLHLIQPQNAWCNGAGYLKGPTSALFRFADQTAEKRTDVEAQQRQAPQSGDHLGRQAFCPCQECRERNTFGWRQAVIASRLGERLFAQPQPFLEDV